MSEGNIIPRRTYLIFRVLVWLTLIPMVGCLTLSNSGQKMDVADPLPKGYEIPETNVLTRLGQSERPAFSPDGNYLAYISRDRLAHKNPQAYILNLKTGTERRITFQYGEVFDVVFGPKPDRLFYSSSTDEIKEALNFRKTKDAPPTNARGDLLPPAEIYTSSLEGDDRERLTQRTGFDGQLSPISKTNELAFTSYNAKTSTSEIHVLKNQRSAKRLTSYSGHEEDAALSRNGKNLVWVRLAPDKKSTQLMMGDGSAGQAHELLSDGSMNLEPRWHPNNEEIVWSSNRSHPDRFQIYILKKDGTCLRQLTFDQGQHMHPNVSPDGESLAYTHEDKLGKKIILMRLNPPPCPDEPPTRPSEPETPTQTS